MTPEEWKALVGKLIRVMYRDQQHAIGIVTLVEEDPYDEPDDPDIFLELEGRNTFIRSEGKMSYYFIPDNPSDSWHVEVWTG